MRHTIPLESKKLESVYQVYHHFEALFLKKQYYILKVREISYKTVY